MQSYRELIVWRKSMNLVEAVYKYTKAFPKEELYCLTSQMRRSSISIPSNIAEGSRRSSRKDFAQFVMIAYGSASELETQLEISQRLGYMDKNSFNEIFGLLQEILKMLNKLVSSLKSTN